MKLGIRSLLVAALIVLTGLAAQTVSAQTVDAKRIEELRAQIEVLQKQLDLTGQKNGEESSTIDGQKFGLITPNGGEIWEADGNEEWVQLKMPADQRYWVTLYLIPQGTTPTTTLPFLPFNPLFGGYDLGSFTYGEPRPDVTVSTAIPEGMPEGDYRLRIYLLPFVEEHPPSPAKALKVDESDGMFTVVTPEQSLNIMPRVISTSEESPVGGDESRADYTIEFSITAFGSDVYISKGAQRDSTPDGSDGIEYVIGKGNARKFYLLGTTSAAFTVHAPVSGDTATHYKIAEGQTRRFELNVSLNNRDAVEGFYDLRFTGLTVRVASSTHTMDYDLEGFRTDTIHVRTENLDRAAPIVSSSKNSSSTKADTTITDRKSL